MIELNNNNPKQCERCIHNRVCSLKDKLKAYIEEYDVLNEKYGVLFPKNPNCPEYLSNGAINRHYYEIPNADDVIKKRTYENLVKTSDGKDKYFKEPNKVEEKTIDKSKTFYYDLDSMSKSNLNFVDEDECCNRKELNEEDFIKALERILSIR